MSRAGSRALPASMALTGLAATFALPGTALAATPAPGGTGLTQLPGRTAPSDSAASLAAPTAAPGGAELHTFQLPSAKTDHGDHQDDADYCGRGKTSANGVPTPERASSSCKYSRDNDKRDYSIRDRESDKYLKHTEANGKYGNPTCTRNHPTDPSAYSFGYNGDPHRHRPSSRDYKPNCDGFHAPKGATSHDNAEYVGTDPSRSENKNYAFGGLL